MLDFSVKGTSSKVLVEKEKKEEELEVRFAIQTLHSSVISTL